MSSAHSIENSFTLRQAVEITGISEFTLRGWECRYGAVRPRRTNSGRRLYSRQDLLKIRALVRLVQKEHRISQIAGLRLQDLQQLLSSSAKSLESDLLGVGDQNEWVSKIMDSATKFNWDQVRTKLFERANSYKKNRIYQFIFQDLLPLITASNSQVANGGFSISQEHILSAFIKEVLYFLKGKTKTPERPRLRFVLATPESELHDIGLLMASTVNSSLGVNQLYIGPNVPKAELVETCLRYRCTHLLLSATICEKRQEQDAILKYIHFVDRHLQPNVQLILAGNHAEKSPVSLGRSTKLIISMAEYLEHLHFLIQGTD